MEIRYMRKFKVKNTITMLPLLILALFFFPADRKYAQRQLYYAGGRWVYTGQL